jgi:metal-dependent HD superfamily phosphatase/phosphodiesterase
MEDLVEATHERAPGQPLIRVPSRRNPRLSRVLERVNADVELQTLWRCANVNAVDRLRLTDHGPVHVQIVANAALRILQLLTDAGIAPSVVANYGLAREDAEVVVVLGALLHDLGIAVHRDEHEHFSLVVAAPKLRELLAGVYEPEPATIVWAETMHAIISHRWDVACLTIEAGVVKVADALDMAKGRSRIPFELGKVDIHSVSALAIDSVTLRKGDRKPVAIDIGMSNSAGIFQVDELLRRKLEHSSIRDYVEVHAEIKGEVERRLISIYEIS